jgi:hypothetical protein
MRLFTTSGPPVIASWENVCVGFVDVTRIRRESGVYVTQMLGAKSAYDVRTPATRGARNKRCYISKQSLRHENSMTNLKIGKG